MKFEGKAPDFGKDEATITALNLKSWFYREVEKKTYAEIGKKLNVDPRNVPSYIKRFKENYKIILNLTRVLGETPLIPRVKSVQDMTAKIAKRREEGKHWGSIARGLEVVDGKLVASKSLDDIKLVQDLFQGANDGKTLGQLSRDLNLTKRAASYTVRNPNYRGTVVDPVLFDKVQEKVKEWRYHGALPYGILSYNEDGDPVWDHEKTEEMKEVINDRKEGMSWNEISKKHGWPTSTATKRIINPVYCGMQWKDGKLVKAHNRPIISVETWRAANKAKAPLRGGLFKKELEKENRNKILAFLDIKSKFGLTTHVIVENTKLSRSCVKRHLKQLEKDGFVVNNPPFWRRKF